MSRSVSTYQRNEPIKKIAVMTITALTSVVSLSFFLIPAKVFSAEMNGTAQIIATLLCIDLGIYINTGIFILFSNIPVFILGLTESGRQSMILSFISVTGISVVIMFVPTVTVTTNPLVNVIMGGVLASVDAGLSLRMSFSTGDMDTISLILSRIMGKIVGNFMFSLNGIIVLLAGSAFNWEGALYIIVSIYCLSQVVDMIHTSHRRATVMTVITRPEAVVLKVSQQIARGMTLLPPIGGHSGAGDRMIMTVITRYELYDLEQTIYSIDEDTFINTLPTQSILGHFVNEDEQWILHSTGIFLEFRSYRMKRCPPKKKLKQ